MLGLMGPEHCRCDFRDRDGPVSGQRNLFEIMASPLDHYLV